MAADSKPIIDLSDELRRYVDHELESGEKLLWLQKPKARPYLQKGIALGAFGLVWSCALIYTIVADLSSNSGFSLGHALTFLLRLIFLLPGLVLLTAPIWYWNKARRTMYAITDIRVIIWEGFMTGGAKPRAYPADELNKMRLYEKPDGSGDLIFSELAVRSGATYATVKKGFFGTPRVAEAQAVIQRNLLPRE